MAYSATQSVYKKNKLASVLGLLLLIFPLIGWCQEAVVQNIRSTEQGAGTRLVFDVSAPVEHSLFTLSAPERVVIDLAKTQIAPAVIDGLAGNRYIKNVRHARREGGNLRVVLDLEQHFIPKSFLLPPSGSYGHRLVIDLHRSAAVVQKPVVTRSNIERKKYIPRDVVIAIDAGHGGKDPGATGRKGTREKNVVLAIAQELEALISREQGMRPLMVRDKDVFLSLRDRIKRARDNKADIFISIHADAAKDKRATGSSVYVLSRNGASSEAARWLAKRENSADLIGGVSLDGKDKLLASVLLDLSQTATIEDSVDLADDLLTQLKHVGEVKHQRVEQAGFVVLKSPDIPSVLVETAFISNPAEEKRLRSRAYQKALAKAMLKGLRSYFKNNAPPGTILANIKPSQHVIQQGETLSGIAARYQVNIRSIRSYNALNSDKIRAGQILKIPVMGG